MSFNLKSYVNTVKKAVRATAPKLRETAGDALYYALCAAPLLALGQLGSEKEIIAGAVALVGSVGGNLLANVAQKVKDDGQQSLADQVEQIAVAVDQNPALQNALDDMLKTLDVIQTAQQAQQVEQRQWFIETLQKQLEMLDSNLTIDSSGGAVIQGSVTVHPNGHFVGRDHVVNHYYGAQYGVSAKHYLTQLSDDCQKLPLVNTQAKNERDVQHAPLTLAQIYITLNTTSVLDLQKMQVKAEYDADSSRSDMMTLGRERDKTRFLTAHEAVIRHRKVILHGEPGSGKSAFVNQLAIEVAQAQLGKQRLQGRIGVLRGLCPIITNLRMLGQALKRDDWEILNPNQQRNVLYESLWAHWCDMLKQLGVDGFEAGLKQQLLDGKALLIFDGLDEVTPRIRERVLACVQHAVKLYCKPDNDTRVIVTVRSRSFRPDLLPQFAAFQLARFTDGQIKDFCQRWYFQQPQRGSETQKQTWADDLYRSATASDEISDITAIPLLLTIMALVHQNGNKKLPDQRTLLYEEAIDVLLDRWQEAKEIELTLTMKDVLSSRNKPNVILALRHLAYIAHCHQEDEHGKNKRMKDPAELTRTKVFEILTDEGYLTDEEAEEFLVYVDHTAGLFAGRGGDDINSLTYRFPHRTFQEFLAGCFLALPEPDDARSVELYCDKCHKDDYWEIAAQLGAEYQLYTANLNRRWLPLVYQLCPSADPSEPEKRSSAYWRQILWSATYAALDAERVKRDKRNEENSLYNGGAKYLARVRERLLTIMRQRKLPAKERAAAGRALAKLGDPRREVTTVEAMRWVCIPKGPFIRGSDKNYDDEKPQMRVNVDDDYYLSQYPVTQAQYAQFVAAQGYAEPRWWGEAKEAGYWQADKGFKGPYDDDFRTASRHYGEPFSLPNHPVVGVSWYEAVAFTRWLNEEVKNDRCVLHDHQAKPLTGKFEIRLPSETEWEKAARGTKDARAYGWGDTPNPDLANYDPTGLGATSAVGCFPNGDAHEFAVEEMNGNVWEWCITPRQSSYKDYDDTKDIKNNTSNILRGGSWVYDDDDLRVSYRNRYAPVNHDNLVGFRLLALPISSL